MKKYPGLFIANIIGLSVGILAAMFIYIYSLKELSADRFHDNSKDIYRITSTSSYSSSINSSTFFPVGEKIKESCPEIINYSRLITNERLYSIRASETVLKKQSITYVDKGFFEMFSFKLFTGNYHSLFENPNNIIISQRYAQKLFKTSNPIGETIAIKTPNDSQNYTVAGVLKNFPDNSTITPDLIVNIEEIASKYSNDWGILSPQLFVQIPSNCDKQSVENKISDIVNNERKKRYAKFNVSSNTNYNLQPLSKIYINSTDVADPLPKGDLKVVKILILCGIVLLTVVSLNYIILNLGFYIKNSSQLKIQSTLGASKSIIIKKFLHNSLLIAFLAFIACIILYPVFYKLFASIWDIRYHLYAPEDYKIWLGIILLILILGTLNGLLQYVFTSYLINSKRISNKQGFTTGLITFQFTMFIIAVVTVSCINKQLNYISNSDKGFDTEHTYNLSFQGFDNLDKFKNEFEKYPFIKNMSVGQCLYQYEYRHNPFKVENSNKVVEAQQLIADHNYLDTYGIKLLEGKNLSKEKIQNQGYEICHSGMVIPDVLVNEAFVKKAGLKNPVGTILPGGAFPVQIVGVFKNVKNLPFYFAAKPIVLGYNLSGSISQLNISVLEGHEKDFLDAVTNFYEKQGLEEYLEFLVWHYNFEKEYQKEANLKAFFNIITTIILFVLLIGVIGLSMHVAEIKTKEVGVRKVNGATIPEIMILLNNNFLKGIIVAFAIASPISWLVMHKWLENFAFKTTLSWWLFAMAGIVALGIALLTVTWQSYRAAVRNPVEALRYE